MKSGRSEDPGTRAAERLSPRHRALTYLACGLVYVSGVFWLVVHYGAAGQDSASSPQPLEPWLLKLHGAAAMGFLIVLGSLLARHVAEAWTAHRNVPSGIAVLATAICLVISAWGLYYAGGEQLRDWLSAGHWLLFVSAAPLLLMHVVSGRRQKAKPRSA